MSLQPAEPAAVGAPATPDVAAPTPTAAATSPAPAAAVAASAPAAASPAAASPAAAATTPAAAPAPATAPPQAAAPEEKKEEGKEIDAEIAFHGAMEAYYAYNTNRPSNDVTNWRWYDHRHNTFGLQGLWFVPEWSIGPVKGHFQLQLGVLAELFWYSERSLEEDLLWRLLQEATMEWTSPWKRLSIEGGIFNVPFGPEWNLAFRNWNWSTGNLFALMPYQISGFRANFDLGRGFVGRIGVYNGWDRIVQDNNKQKAMMASFEWTDPKDEENYFIINYMVGNERYLDDARGRTPRHTFDVYGQWHIARPLSLRLWTFSGFEKKQQAIDGWLGLSAFAKIDPVWWLSIAPRGDYVYTRADTENLFHSDIVEGPGKHTAVASGTLTLDFHPSKNVSFRLEGRHDAANFNLFYRGNVALSDPADPRSFVTNARQQTTILAGMTTWF